MPVCRYLISLGLITSAALAQVSCTQVAKHKNTQQQSLAPVSSDNATPRQVTNSVPPASAVTGVESAVRQAVGWNPTILEAAGRIKQQNENVADARSGYLPSIGGGVDLGLQRGDTSDFGPRFNVSATQMVYDFGKVSGRVDAESAVHDVRKAEFLATVDDVIRDTVLASVEILRNERLERVAREQISDVQAIGKLVDARTDRGASTRSDKLQAEARVQAAETTALEIGAQKQRWENTLNVLVGSNTPVRLTTAFPASMNSACSGPQPIWETVPAVVAAKSRKVEADARVKLARAEMLPTVALQASTQVNLLGDDSDPDYVIGFRIEGDLYNGGSFRARQNAARYAAQASEAAIASAQFNVRRSWIESAAQVGSLSLLQKSLGTRQTLMRETRDLYQRQFLDLGTRTLLDVLNADQELHAARFDEINTQFDLYKLKAECAYASGRLREVFGLTPDNT